MDVVLKDVLMCSYIDDMVIYSTTRADHCYHLTLVLQKVAGCRIDTEAFQMRVGYCFMHLSWLCHWSR